MYTNICPIHGNNLTTTKTRELHRRSTGILYTKPLYYCKRCHRYYVFFEEVQGYRKTFRSADGIPIDVIGSYGVIRKDGKYVIQKHSVTEPLIVQSVPEGMKLPTTCSECGKRSYNVIYTVNDELGLEETFHGRMCFSCGRIFFSQSITRKHSELFNALDKLFVYNSDNSNIQAEAPEQTIIYDGNRLNVKPINKGFHNDNWFQKYCAYCDKYLIRLRYIVKDPDGAQKPLRGWKCTNCGNNYFQRSIIQKYPQYFSTDNLSLDDLQASFGHYEELVLNPGQILKIYPTPIGEKLPDTCPFCKSRTLELTYRIRGWEGTKKYLIGRECTKCKKFFFSERVIQKYPEQFADIRKKEQQQHFIPETLKEIDVEEEGGKVVKVELPDPSEISRKSIEKMAVVLMRELGLSRNQAILELDRNGWTLFASFEQDRLIDRLCDKYPILRETATSLLQEYNNRYSIVVQKIYADPTVLKHTFEIRLADVVVRTNVFSCIKKSHQLLEVNAIVFYLDKEGKLKSHEIMAGYCADCKQYYLLEEDYRNIKKLGYLCCRVIDEKKMAHENKATGFKFLNSRSVMYEYGYNVSSINALTDAQRERILSMIIDAGILKKTQICAHIDWCIQIRESQYDKFENAINKWKRDRKFVESYVPDEYEQIVVRKLIRK